MTKTTLSDLVTKIKQGQLPDAQSWDIADAVQLLIDDIGRPTSTVTFTEIRAAMKVLNDQRHYDHSRRLGQAWRDAKRPFDATITKRHAQAEINLSALDTAQALVDEGLTQTDKADVGADAASEAMEFKGLLGRIYKQRFVATGNKDDLVQALQQYLKGHRSQRDEFWHGINAVALLARLQRSGVSWQGDESLAALAAGVRKTVTRLYKKNSADPWLPATASEASLALGRQDHAELWLYRFLHHAKTQPFDIESYGRQLREIWEGNATERRSSADRLAAIVETYVAHTQGRWTVSAKQVPALSAAIANNPQAFELNFAGERGFSLASIKKMLSACASIGCVCDEVGRRLGTGFLLPGSSLRADYGPEPVFVTNAHVIGSQVQNAIPPEKARVTFEVESAALSEPKFYKVQEQVLFTSPAGDIGRPADDKLDITVVHLHDMTPTYSMLNPAKSLPSLDAKTRVFVVGHPQGAGLQISLQDSALLDIDAGERLVHYRTPTDPGNSGSPVFNAKWDVIAVHHSGSAETPRLHGSGTYEANEGIALTALCRVLNA